VASPSEVVVDATEPLRIAQPSGTILLVAIVFVAAGYRRVVASDSSPSGICCAGLPIVCLGTPLGIAAGQRFWGDFAPKRRSGLATQAILESQSVTAIALLSRLLRRTST
jgi:hypothetical protein